MTARTPPVRRTTPPQRGTTAQPPQSPRETTATPQAHHPTARPPIGCISRRGWTRVFRPPWKTPSRGRGPNGRSRRTSAPSAQMPNAFHDGNSTVVAARAYDAESVHDVSAVASGNGSPAPSCGPVQSPECRRQPVCRYLMAILRELLYPTHARSRSRGLETDDWDAQPQIVDILVKTAKDDPAPTVRAGMLLRSLSRMAVTTAPAYRASARCSKGRPRSAGSQGSPTGTPGHHEQ